MSNISQAKATTENHQITSRGLLPKYSFLDKRGHDYEDISAVVSDRGSIMGSVKSVSIFRWAAVVGILAGASFWLYRGWFQGPRTVSPASAIISSKTVAKAASKVQIANLAGQRPVVPTIDIGSIHLNNISGIDPQTPDSLASLETPGPSTPSKHKRKASKGSVAAASSANSASADNVAGASPNSDQSLYLPMAATDDADAANDEDVRDSMRARTVSVPRVRGSVQADLPPLEIDRLKSENQFLIVGQQTPSDLNAHTIKIDADFECGTAIKVEQKSPTHFLLTLANQTALRDWFMFRISGAAGKIVRVDIHGGDADERKWTSLNPVFARCESLDDPTAYSTVAPSAQAKPTKAWNGSVLPSTEDQQWHFIEQCWMDDTQTFSFVQQIDLPAEYVAMRVPRPQRYNEQFLKQLAGNPLAKVINVGKSKEGHPLQLVKISLDGNDADRQKPLVLVYAGEHADEFDAMWAAQGLIEDLASGGEPQMALLGKVSFIVIPTLDPDATSHGRHEGIITAFTPATVTTESKAWSAWFQEWVVSGRRLDLVIDLHNVQSNEAPNVSCALMEGYGKRGHASKLLNKLVCKNAETAGYVVATKPWNTGYSPDRLGGWLGSTFGALSISYEINSEANPGHLNFWQMKHLGWVICDPLDRFFNSSEGKDVLSSVESQRIARSRRWETRPPEMPPTLANAIYAEFVAANVVADPNTDHNELLHEQNIP